jgi:hypothetical protein
MIDICKKQDFKLFAKCLRMYIFYHLHSKVKKSANMTQKIICYRKIMRFL